MGIAHAGAGDAQATSITQTITHAACIAQAASTECAEGVAHAARSILHAAARMQLSGGPVLKPRLRSLILHPQAKVLGDGGEGAKAVALGRLEGPQRLVAWATFGPSRDHDGPSREGRPRAAAPFEVAGQPHAVAQHQLHPPLDVALGAARALAPVLGACAWLLVPAAVAVGIFLSRGGLRLGAATAVGRHGSTPWRGAPRRLSRRRRRRRRPLLWASRAAASLAPRADRRCLLVVFGGGSMVGIDDKHAQCGLTGQLLETVRVHVAVVVLDAYRPRLCVNRGHSARKPSGRPIEVHRDAAAHLDDALVLVCRVGDGVIQLGQISSRRGGLPTARATFPSGWAARHLSRRRRRRRLAWPFPRWATRLGNCVRRRLAFFWRIDFVLRDIGDLRPGEGEIESLPVEGGGVFDHHPGAVAHIAHRRLLEAHDDAPEARPPPSRRSAVCHHLLPDGKAGAAAGLGRSFLRRLGSIGGRRHVVAPLAPARALRLLLVLSSLGCDAKFALERHERAEFLCARRIDDEEVADSADGASTSKEFCFAQHEHDLPAVHAPLKGLAPLRGLVRGAQDVESHFAGDAACRRRHGRRLPLVPPLCRACVESTELRRRAGRPSLPLGLSLQSSMPRRKNERSSKWRNRSVTVIFLFFFPLSRFKSVNNPHRLQTAW